ncbi:hypothetical protein BD413DRAFT_484127, partial [Trametes elegans]
CVGVSRRDDVESLLYVLLWFYHTDHAPSKPLHTFLARSLPEFAAYHAHCLGLSYEEKPDYALLHALFRNRMEQEGWACDWMFDWVDGSKLWAGTLLPEEYILDWKMIGENGWDPVYM